MNVDIRTEAAQFLFGEYINWIFFAVRAFSDWYLRIWATRVAVLPGFFLICTEAGAVQGSGRKQDLPVSRHPQSQQQNRLNIYSKKLLLQETSGWLAKRKSLLAFAMFIFIV
jgi:hypothetical protein